ncbi:hypothetical protein AWB61_10095 [Chromobacterium sp. F49]|nr:hypothetical protein Cv017_12245 [Chromobacterium subtsugae]KZE87765.1 hypothetical protein AWB61_10095 [Chromobacterium sp. F49]
MMKSCCRGENFRALLEAAAKAGARQAFDEAGVVYAVKLATRVDGVADAVLKALAGDIVIGLLGAIWAVKSVRSASCLSCRCKQDVRVISDCDGILLAVCRSAVL